MGGQASKVEDSPFSVSTVTEKETVVEEIRNFEALIETEETELEDKAKNVPKVVVKREPMLQYIIP